MGQIIKSEDGTEIEVFTGDEIEQQKQAAIEQYKIDNPDKGDELILLQEELRVKQEELSKVKEKDLATEMTTVNTKRNNFSRKEQIKGEHVKNNSGVRKVLVDAGIKPEELPPSEDITKIERKHRAEKALMEERHKKELLEAQKKSESIK